MARNDGIDHTIARDGKYTRSQIGNIERQNERTPSLKLPSLLIGRKNVIRTDVLKAFLTLNQGVNLLELENVRAI